jgi:cell division protein FtsX
MKSVMFAFDEQASEENQDRIRNQILNLPGVYNVGRISPNATKPALRRFWYAEVADEAAASNLVTRLREHDDVQSADLPAERGLI